MFDLKATHNPHRWYLKVERNLCTGPAHRQFLFGGIGMAASIHAMEQTCQRPVIWATAQYLSFALPGKMVDLDVVVPVAGRLTTQANVVLHIDDQKIIAVQAALGAREDAAQDQWVTMPDVAPPEQCAEANYWRGDGTGLNARLEIRVAQGRFHGDRQISQRGDGRLIFWLRSREGHAVDSGMLAIAADYVASGIAGATGLNAGGNSLDNTIRFGRIVPCEWILCDVHIETLTHGIVHGRMHLYSPDGVLMASAGQSMILRVHPAAG
jgi:acyl-CoA thioesterase II